MQGAYDSPRAVLDAVDVFSSGTGWFAFVSHGWIVSVMDVHFENMTTEDRANIFSDNEEDLVCIIFLFTLLLLYIHVQYVFNIIKI